MTSPDALSTPVAVPSPRLAYDDLASPRDMLADCRAAGLALGLDRHLERRLERAARAAVAPAPSIRFEDLPRETPKPEIRISAAAARLADALHLHLD